MLNAAAQSIEDLRDARVDREEEFSKAYSALANNVQNVLLYGTRGAGKTFITRLLEDEIRRENDDVFTCMVNLANLHSYGDNSDDESDAFPRAVLLQLCTALWTRVIGKNYLQLKDVLSSSGHELRSISKEEKSVQDIYAHLMQYDLLHRASRTNTAGMNLVAKGELQEHLFHENRQSSILPFEFGEFVTQLLTDVLEPKGKEKIIVLCDEANHAKFYQQEQILERYFELFSSRRVQFLFVAAQGPWQEREYIPSCFETTIELCGLKEQGDISSLIKGAAIRDYGDKFEFADEAIELIIDVFSGHPRNTLNASQRAIEFANEAASQKVTVREALRACREIEKQLSQYEKTVRDISG